MSEVRVPVELVSESQVIRGVIVNATPFGFFIELVPRRLDGLLQFERTPYPEIARLFRVGDEIEVIVREVDAYRGRVRLEMLPAPTRYDGFWSRGASTNN